MKNYYLSFSILFLLNLSVCAQVAKKETKEQGKQAKYEKVIALIESGKYEFIGRKANPQQGRQIDLSTRNNYLRIDGENATAEMPFFGRAYSGGYSNSDGGIKFDGPMENYAIEKNDKKRRLTIKFGVKGAGDNYRCTLSISGLESATLSIVSNNRQTISYTGGIREVAGEQ